ncbi:MAG: glycosyltransferase family 4 protein [gamma proteobacterium symbiont of Bathyaustriella thionipta]|nr:glycosyltransferase family 4 protein [gamma proteobacterium symbiont of Bathyaustriella thionipta]MCU7948680.1 glycosyltransferase family 4 protein [gamma proteobacterium symbiont of Bathyaustriella thionipta]MCU7952614.1 glycosyltransferase family 4 protein [gamma proteobacterium symbiont of Bathyaustriella thionipta]MCU7955111.1 glycosyltransferase family 4 protein [gamma proteobacterium symbiont of Bathyaustriella thionipta]
MKLAFVLFKYFPYGGLERDFLRIAKICQSRGHEIFVYSFIWEGDVPEGFNLTLIPVKGISNHQRISDFSNKFSQLVLNKEATERFDLVVGFNKMKDLDLYYAADPCYEAKVREQHGKLYRLGKRYKVFQGMEASVFARDKNVELLFISDIQMENFKKIYHTPAERFHSLPPGVDRSRIRPDNADEIRARVRNDLSLKEDDKLLLMIGTGYRRKGVDRAMEALASLSEPLRSKTYLLVAGEDKISKYKALAKKLGIENQVHLPGARDDVPELLLASDLFMHPARHENTGTVLLEAIAAGIPQVISGVCGYAFHIENAQAGKVLSEPFQQTQYNQVLADMLTSDDWQQWQDNALHYMRNSDIFSMPDKVSDIIEATGKQRSVANIYKNYQLD